MNKNKQRKQLTRIRVFFLGDQEIMSKSLSANEGNVIGYIYRQADVWKWEAVTKIIN